MGLVRGWGVHVREDPCDGQGDDGDDDDDDDDVDQQGRDVQPLGRGAVAQCPTVVTQHFAVPGLGAGRGRVRGAGVGHPTGLRARGDWERCRTGLNPPKTPAIP